MPGGFDLGGMTEMGGQGGPMGMMGMDVGMYKMPIVGSFFQDPNELFQKQQMHQMGKAYASSRPELAQERMNVVRGGAAPYQGASDMLSSMMGQGGQPGAWSQSPVSPTMQGLGAPMDMGPNPQSNQGGGGLMGGMLGGDMLGGLMGGAGGGLGGGGGPGGMLGGLPVVGGLLGGGGGGGLLGGLGGGGGGRGGGGLLGGLLGGGGGRGGGGGLLGGIL